jgi:hypothetical protein
VGFIKRRADHFTLDGALHVGDFFGALIDQKNNQRHFRMIDGNGIGDRLQHHGFAGSRRRVDQSALTFTDGAEQIKHASGQVFLGGFHLQSALGI